MRVNCKSTVIGLLAAGTVLYYYISRWGPDLAWYYVPYPGNYRFRIDNAHTCQRSSPFVVLMVPVAPGERAARDAIRETWGGNRSELGRRVVTLFVLGLPSGGNPAEQQRRLEEENQRHHDLIQSDFLDSYHNLTIKTMMMLEWFKSHCANASYVMKVDSDVFLNVTNLVKLLVDPGHARKEYMTGLIWWDSAVSRNFLNKFYIPRDVIADSTFPPYPLGMSYVMSSDLPGKILAVAPQIRAFFIEDVYLGMCLKHLGIQLTRPPEESMFVVDPPHPLSCYDLSTKVAVMTDSDRRMRTYWRASQQSHTECLASSVDHEFACFFLIVLQLCCVFTMTSA